MTAGSQIKPGVAKKKMLFVLLALAGPLLGGCGQNMPEGPLPTLDDADKKLRQICVEELDVEPVIRRLNNTIWVTVPLEDDLIRIKATTKKAPVTNKAAPGFNVQFLETGWDKEMLTTRYDIVASRKYDQKLGYENSYSEKFSKKQRVLLPAILRAYADVEKVPGDVSYKNAAKQATHSALVSAYLKPDKVPDFFVLYFVDSRNGLAVEMVIYFRDLKKAMSKPTGLPQEEFAQRYLTQLIGDAKLLGDKTGENVQPREITWNEFITRQIDNRIKYKLTRSDFPPKSIYEMTNLILDQYAITLKTYQIEGYSTIELIDLETLEKQDFSREELLQRPDPEAPKAKTIKFGI